MLDMLKEKLLNNTSAAVGAAGALIGCCSVVPPALLFGCRFLTKDCQRTSTPDCYQAEVSAGTRLKMD